MPGIIKNGMLLLSKVDVEQAVNYWIGSQILYTSQQPMLVTHTRNGARVEFHPAHKKEALTEATQAKE